MTIRELLEARRLPLCGALFLATLMVFSYIGFGAVSPPGPQLTANAAYQKLWAGDIAGAVTGFDRALQDDAAFPFRWSDLGEALADAGKMEQARYCFRRAVELAPESPEIRLRAANFSFRAGSVADALSLDSKALSQTPAFDQMIFRSWIRMAGDVGLMLDTGIGANARAARAFFDFLATQGKKEAADKAWRWMDSPGYIEPRQGREWADLLLRSNLPAEAADVWAAHVASDPAEYRKSNWLDDAGFEDNAGPENNWQGGAFDWTSLPCPGVTITADSTMAHSGTRSLRIDVNSAENLDFHHFSQRTWLAPGKYRLEGWIRTKGFTTNQGIGLRAWEPGHESELNALTPAVTGTHEWTRITHDFAVIAQPAMVEIQIVRGRSWEFDNHPRGNAWIDDIRLQPLP